MCILVLMLLPGIALVVGFVAGRRISYGLHAGEAMVANAISAGLEPPHLLLNNVTLGAGEWTSQIDHIVVAETGIFVIETKHYSGWIFGDAKARQWTKVIYKQKFKFQNPIHQNYGHVEALRSLFKLPADAFISVVVFTGDAEFKTNLGPNVLKLPELLGFLGGERPVVFDERKMTFIVRRIEMKRLRRSVETDEYHLSRIRQRISTFGP